MMVPAVTLNWYWQETQRYWFRSGISVKALLPQRTQDMLPCGQRSSSRKSRHLSSVAKRSIKSMR